MRHINMISHSSDNDETKANTVEYCVYIHLPTNQNNRFWEKATTTSDKQLAMEQAELLHYSQKYPRVEVKRKFFCAKQKRKISETLRIFDAKSNTCTYFQNWIARLVNFAF